MPGETGQLLVWAKSALLSPSMVMALMDKSASPVLARTINCEVLAVPWPWAGKLN